MLYYTCFWNTFITKDCEHAKYHKTWIRIFVVVYILQHIAKHFINRNKYTNNVSLRIQHKVCQMKFLLLNICCHFCLVNIILYYLLAELGVNRFILYNYCLLLNIQIFNYKWKCCLLISRHSLFKSFT